MKTFPSSARKFPLEALLILWRHSEKTYNTVTCNYHRVRIFKLASWLGPEFSWPQEAQDFKPPQFLHYCYEWDSLQAHFKVPPQVLSYYACKWSEVQRGNLQQ